MNNKILKCQNCDKELLEGQKRFCSRKCQKKYSKRENDKIAYTIDDKNFGELKIKHTANAWWKDEGKVVKLIRGLKMDCKPRELRLLAGITQDQYDYFLKIHPDFSVIFKDFRAIPSIKARQTVMMGIQKDPNIAFKYLERKEPDEFKEKRELEVSEKPILIDDIMNNDEKRKGGDAQ
jgi:hypothetical protein